MAPRDSSTAAVHLEDGARLVCLDTLRHHVQDVVHHRRSQLQVEVRLHPLLRHRLRDTLGVSAGKTTYRYKTKGSKPKRTHRCLVLTKNQTQARTANTMERARDARSLERNHKNTINIGTILGLGAGAVRTGTTTLIYIYRLTRPENSPVVPSSVHVQKTTPYYSTETYGTHFGRRESKIATSSPHIASTTLGFVS